ncbi:DUF2513 domain-containing protein [Pseudoruegeria sp. HB172150]|uniref:DUF2513 domain-containing protein n=1 Tax=Pseudoruegeria sp. HB172150 TaxID=2721164 RepID=UPI0015523BFD|nr:DUF2513 domain-containing protein [Pseudoruegeria sp. HB172150]
MKRDDDYIRELLFAAEAEDDPHVIAVKTLGADQEEVRRIYHIDLLSDAGLMVETGKGVFRLTNQGHDYIEAIRSDTVWKKTKEGAQAVGGATLNMMKDMAIAYLKKEAAEKLGIQF